jgi:hypothetical protein
MPKREDQLRAYVLERLNKMFTPKEMRQLNKKIKRLQAKTGTQFVQMRFVDNKYVVITPNK